jgi:hypothetical protein
MHADSMSIFVGTNKKNAIKYVHNARAGGDVKLELVLALALALAMASLQSLIPNEGRMTCW